MLRLGLPLIAIGFLPLAAAAAGPQAAPGKWEITTTMTMQGPQGNHAMPAHTMTTCIKPEDAANVQRHFSPGPGGQPQDKPNKDCKMIDQSASADTIKFHMKCEGARASEVVGQVSYAPGSYHGHADITATSPKGAMHMTTDFKGKRVGGC